MDEWIHERDDYSMEMIEEQNGEEGTYLHPRQVLREPGRPASAYR